MPREGRCTTCEKFVFRGIEKPKGASGHTWAGKRKDMLELNAMTPIGRSTYKKYLCRFREALIDCCGFTSEAVRQFGMHSMRVGGTRGSSKTKCLKKCVNGWAVGHLR